LPRKRNNEDEMDDEDVENPKAEEEDDDDDDLDDDEDTIDLDKAEEEEDDDDDVDDDDDEDEDAKDSVEEIERKRLFQAQAEEVLETLTMDDVKEVLKENEMDLSLAPKLKKALLEVVNEGEVATMDEAWEEAVERLEE
jgi:hypothetical protein